MPAKWHKYSYSAQREERKTFVSILFLIVSLLIVFTIVHNNLITVYRLGSDTMEPTIGIDHAIVATPIYTLTIEEQEGLSGVFKSGRGDLVLVSPAYTRERSTYVRFFRSLVSFLTFQRVRPFSSTDLPGEKPLIRRVLGYPGDSLYMKDFILYIKPTGASHYLTEFELVNRVYDILIDPLPENWNNSLPLSASFAPITLGENEYFLLCDNRKTSSDCRIWGPLNASRIEGKVLLRYWPFSLFGKL